MEHVQTGEAGAHDDGVEIGYGSVVGDGWHQFAMLILILLRCRVDQ